MSGEDHWQTRQSRTNVFWSLRHTSGPGGAGSWTVQIQYTIYLDKHKYCGCIVTHSFLSSSRPLPVFFPTSSCLLPDLFLSSSRLLPVFFLSSSRILSVLFPSYSLLPRRWSPSGRVDTTLGLKHVVRVESGGEELVLQRLVDTWFCQLWCTQHYTALETSPAILVLYLSNSTWRIIIY